VALTAGALLAVVVAGWVGRYAFGRTGDHRHTRVLNVAVASAMLGVLAAAGGFIVYLWNAEAAVVDAVSTLANPVHTATLVAVTLAVLAGGYVATGLVHQLVRRIARMRDGVSEHQAEIVYRVLQLSVYAIAAIVVLGVWNVNLGGLLVGAGFAGIVLGMAARQTLGALLAGFVLMFSRPFEIGDWIQVDDKEGIVTDITIVNTRIQTFDGEYVMLPNDIVSSNKIVNRTRKGRLRIEVEVGVDYATDLDEAIDAARDGMADVESILTVPRPQVVCKEFAASAIVLGLRFWIDKPSARKRWRARTAVVQAVKSAFDERGVKIPFPQREIAGRAETGGFRVATDGETVPGEEVTEPDD